MPPPVERNAAAYTAVFLIMMSNLMLELLLTRIFSATMWYHFAFMAVSIALFGTTVGAVVVHLFPRHFADGRVAARYALLYAISIVACTLVYVQLPVTFGDTWHELAMVTLLYVVIAVPFALSGIFICRALIHAQRVGAVYCADLLGAGFGCAVFVSLMTFSDGPRGALLLAGLGAAGAALAAAAARDRWTRAAGWLCAAASVVVFLGHIDGTNLKIQWSKGHPDGHHAFEKWNAFSRLLVDPLGEEPWAWGLSTRVPSGAYRVDQKRLTIDGTAATVLTAFDGDLSKVEFLQRDVTALAHAIRRGGSVLVIGVGGGRDVLTALSAGHQRIVGAEVNGDILGLLLEGPFAAFTGHLAMRPEVEFVHDEARSYAARTPDRFDIIQASLVDTWAAAANGAYVLSENALYTLEAFRIFLDRLSPDGILSMSRCYLKGQPGETLRLVSLAAAALRERGVEQPQNHLFMARKLPGESAVATLLISTRPFTPSELETLREWCREQDFEELLGPGKSANPAFAKLAGPRESATALQALPIDVTPPRDDRPFFFHMLRMRDVFRADRPTDAVGENILAVATLAWLLLIVVVLSGLFILAPLWLSRRRGAHATHVVSRVVYFTGLGLGFILIELAQMQRLMIALGHPVYGLTVVLFSLLVAAGFGSLWAQRMLGRGASAAWLRRALVGAIVLGAATALAGLTLAQAVEGAPSWLRIAGSIAVLAPLGFVLGIPLASGLALSASDDASYRALYWGVNGAASVCGSVLATILSLAFGITFTFGVGVAAYVVSTGAALVAFPTEPA